MKAIAIDTETTGIHAHFGDLPFAVSTCDDSGNVKYWEWDVEPTDRYVNYDQTEVNSIKKLIDKHDVLVFHNAKFDIRMLSKMGITIPWEKVVDTGIMSHIFNSYVHASLRGKLKPLALKYLDIADEDEQELRQAVSKSRLKVKELGWAIAEAGDGKGDHIARDYWLPRAVAKHLELGDNHEWMNVLGTYAAIDAVRTMNLYSFFLPEVMRRSSKQFKRECELIRVTYEMEENGLTVNSRELNREYRQFTKDAIAFRSFVEQVSSSDEFNIDSPIHMRNLVYTQLKLPVYASTPNGEPSLDKNSRKAILKSTKTLKQQKLEAKFESLVESDEYDLEMAKRIQERILESMSLGHKVVWCYDRYQISNTAVKYLKGYKQALVNDRIFPSLNQVGTGTTRYSGSDPNPQNISKGKELDDGEKPEYNLRSVFGPLPGWKWYCVDYSQLQLRIFAYVSGEKSMIRAFQKGYDFHTFVASTLLGRKIGDITDIERREYGKNVNFGFIFGKRFPDDIADMLARLFPTANDYMERIKREVYINKYVTTPHGYRLYLPFENGKIKAHAGVNYIVQGCEGDIVKNAMLLCSRYLRKKKNFKLIMQVHDELVFCCRDNHPEEHKIINHLMKLMEKPGLDVGMVTPVDAKWTTTNWSETVKYEVEEVV
jgi:DNA polymerase-1